MNYTSKAATLSDCGNYRYQLDRWWYDGKPERTCVFIMLNPSTADSREDDPTIRRCVGFAQAWGYNHLRVVNLFAFRASSPAEMLAAADPVGADNNGFIIDAVITAGLIVAAWGQHGSHRGRDRELLDTITWDLRCLGTTKSGQPRHPLYIRNNFYPVKFTPNWRTV